MNKKDLAFDIARSIWHDLNIQPDQYADDKASPQYLKWMCDQIMWSYLNWDVDKSHRWIGYIQGCLIATGQSTLEIERDRVRNLQVRKINILRKILRELFE